jgi:hypothetical protein
MFRVHNSEKYLGLRGMKQQATATNYIRVINREVQNYSSHDTQVGSRTQGEGDGRIKNAWKILTGKIREFRKFW